MKSWRFKYQFNFKWYNFVKRWFEKRWCSRPWSWNCPWLSNSVNCY